MDTKYEQWAEQKFEGLSRAELREVGKVFGCTFPPNMGETQMRVRLCEVAGAGAVQHHVDAPTQLKDIPKLHGRPGLGPTETWGGRRHDVQVHHSEMDKEHKAFTLTWNGDTKAFAFDEVVHMPEPFFNILKTSVIKDVKQRAIKDSEGRLVRMESYDVSKPRFSYNYSGLTKGTEELCGSILEYWQRKAKEHDYFKSLVSKPGGRKALIKIYSDLTEPKGPDYYKDKTSEDILVDVLQFLGFEDVLHDDIEQVLVA